MKTSSTLEEQIAAVEAEADVVETSCAKGMDGNLRAAAASLRRLQAAESELPPEPEGAERMRVMASTMGLMQHYDTLRDRCVAEIAQRKEAEDRFNVEVDAFYAERERAEKAEARVKELECALAGGRP